MQLLGTYHIFAHHVQRHLWIHHPRECVPKLQRCMRAWAETGPEQDTLISANISPLLVTQEEFCMNDHVIA